MPEGDTIHKLARYLAPWLPGRHVACCETGARPERRLDLQVAAVEAVGKHLLLRLRPANDDSATHECVLRTHLGMWGSWQQLSRTALAFSDDPVRVVVGPAVEADSAGYPRRDSRHLEPPFARSARPADEVEASLRTRFHQRRRERVPPVVLWLDDRVLICWQPKEVEWLSATAMAASPLAARAGPDLTAVETERQAQADGNFWPTFVDALRTRTPAVRPVLDVLLDQRLAAGIGNVYKSELLFLHRLHPLAPLEQVADARLAALYADAQRLLRRNLTFGPRITRAQAEPGEHLFVYGRRGLPCRVCGNPVAYRRWGEHLRSTYFCPVCQSSPDAAIAAGIRRDRSPPSATLHRRRQRGVRPCS